MVLPSRWCEYCFSNPACVRNIRVRVLRYCEGCITFSRRFVMALPKEVMDWLFGGIGVVLGWLGKWLHSILGDKSKE